MQPAHVSIIDICWQWSCSFDTLYVQTIIMPIRAIMYIRLLIIVNTYDKLLHIAKHAAFYDDCIDFEYIYVQLLTWKLKNKVFVT